MTRAMLAVVAMGVLIGFGARSVWGVGAGVATGVLVIVLGAVVLTLRRNQADLRELEEDVAQAARGDRVENGP